MCDSVRSDCSFTSSTSSGSSRSGGRNRSRGGSSGESECEFPLFRQTFWFAATWTDDVDDDDRLLRQEIQRRSSSQRSRNYVDLGSLQDRRYDLRSPHYSVSSRSSSRSSAYMHHSSKPSSPSSLRTASSSFN